MAGPPPGGRMEAACTVVMGGRGLWRVVVEEITGFIHYGRAGRASDPTGGLQASCRMEEAEETVGEEIGLGGGGMWVGG